MLQWCPKDRMRSNGPASDELTPPLPNTLLWPCQQPTTSTQLKPMPHTTPCSLSLSQDYRKSHQL